MRPDPAHGGIEGPQTPVRSVMMAGLAAGAGNTAGPKDFGKDKNKKCHNRGCGIS